MAPFMANAISLDSLNSKSKNFTSLQFEEYLSTLEGIKVTWSGKVLKVKSVISSPMEGYKEYYSVEIDTSATGENANFAWPFETIPSATGFLIERFEASNKTIALKLEKNQEYNFSGEIIKTFKLWSLPHIVIDITEIKLVNN
jgi:hypothetical protein